MSYSPYNRNASGVLFLGSSGSDAKFESRSNFSFNATNGTLGVPVIALSNNVSVSGIETTLSSANDFLATSSAVKTYVDQAVSNGFNANDAMVFKGTLGSGGTETTLPTTYNTGWTFKVVAAGTYAGKVAEVGDMYVALVTRSGSGNQDSDWAVVQANIDGAVTGPVSATSGNFPIFNNDTGKVIANSTFSPNSFVLASDTTVVRTTGNQTIGGNKTFSGVGQTTTFSSNLLVTSPALPIFATSGIQLTYRSPDSDIRVTLSPNLSDNYGWNNEAQFVTPTVLFDFDQQTSQEKLHVAYKYKGLSQFGTAQQVKTDLSLNNVQNIALSGVEIIAGSGLVGGGSIDSTKTLNVAAINDSIEVYNTGIAVRLTQLGGLKILTGLDAGIAIDRQINTISSNTTLTGHMSGYNLVNANGSNITVTLPATISAGRKLVVKKIDSSNNTVTINRGGSSTIDGATSKVLYYQYETLTMISDGTNWFIV
jgi:hypothetical protein